MKKSKWIPLLLTLISWAGMYYYYLPPLNIHSNESWMFFVAMIVVALVINFWTIAKTLFFHKESQWESNPLLKKLLYIPLALVVIYGVGVLLSSPILRASAYSSLLTVQNGDFAEDIHEVNYSQIPILDSDSAAKLAEREMGSMVDMVSQYEVSDYYNQINLNSKPVRVTPLEYGDIIKWITNCDTGIPAYMNIDMTTQDVELVKLPEGQGIKYSPFEHFGRNLYRYVRFRYPTAMIRSSNFEVDDNGVPYWVCSVETKTIGLFGGTDIQGAILVNAATGEHAYYDVADVPQWVDKVYDAELLVEQYDYYGTLQNGFINSKFGQKGCLQTTEGYNYVALNDDVWVYTGVTSIGGDESIVGFVLMNSRTKETNYYQISGAKEISAMASAEGEVQHLGYTATFPILLNIADEPTYFLSLKDAAGLVKKYAMVNIEKYHIVAIGDTVAECEKVYRNLMANSGINVTPSGSGTTAEGKITLLKDIVVDGNTYYYLMLEGREELFAVKASDHLEVLKKQVGSTVKLEYVTETDGTCTVTSLQ